MLKFPPELSAVPIRMANPTLRRLYSGAARNDQAAIIIPEWQGSLQTRKNVAEFFFLEVLFHLET